MALLDCDLVKFNRDRFAFAITIYRSLFGAFSANCRHSGSSDRMVTI
ncbi:hypothetical protein [Chamaesiphon sp. VAR_48_metabat_403]|nr:hypothetical protein [Chamaesiphon sp. VAR_48_metabat_403]